MKSYKFRAFISYCHEDRNKVRELVKILETLNIHCLWDKDIYPGNAFTEEIKGLIARSHIFIPLITKTQFAALGCIKKRGSPLH